MTDQSLMADVLSAKVFIVLHIVNMDEYPIIGVALNRAAAMRMADEGAREHCGGWEHPLWRTEPNGDPLDEEIPEIDNGRPKTVSVRLTRVGCQFEIQEWPIRL